MKFIAKKHYTFAELETRWQCGLDDLIQAVIDGELIPSVHVASGKYGRKLFTVDYDEEAFPSGLQTESLLDGDDLAGGGRVGFHYLIRPRRTGVADCEFCIFSENAMDHDEGDICFELTTPVGISHVLKHGIFMPKEVARVEAISDYKSAVQAIDKPLSTIERNSLLTIIAILCNECKLDYQRNAKTAGLIYGMAQFMKVAIGETTIENHLKKIPDALGTRVT
jgi:hypothetical protein